MYNNFVQFAISSWNIHPKRPVTDIILVVNLVDPLFQELPASQKNFHNEKTLEINIKYKKPFKLTNSYSIRKDCKPKKQAKDVFTVNEKSFSYEGVHKSF